MACFCSSMSHHHSLRGLRLAFSSAEYSHILQQGGASLARLPELWGKVMATLSSAMQVRRGGTGAGWHRARLAAALQ
jgi:hypothetical protein